MTDEQIAALDRASWHRHYADAIDADDRGTLAQMDRVARGEIHPTRPAAPEARAPMRSYTDAQLLAMPVHEQAVLWYEAVDADERTLLSRMGTLGIAPVDHLR